jgi:hypothetical protein
VEAHGALQLAHERDEAEQVTGLFVNMFAEVMAPLGRSFGEQRPGAGRLVCVGRVFSEHTFTKPFAPAGQRKVLAIETPGQPYLPETRYSRRQLPELLRVPSESQVLDASLTKDVAPWSFGLTHTDNNQHVNSLVYARLFEDAALRRFSEHGESTLLLAEAIEIVYRKPCFAGETLTCMLQTFKVGETLQAVGYLGAAGVAPERAHCAIRMRFRHGEPNANGHTHAHPH